MCALARNDMMILERKKYIMLTAKEVAIIATKALDSKKGMNIKLLKIDRVSSLADYFLICTGTSNTHVKTLCDTVEFAMEIGRASCRERV